MEDIAFELERLPLRERLYCEVPSVQYGICSCYVDILKFWYHVYNLCTKPWYRSFGKLAAKSKAKAIMDSLRSHTDRLISQTEEAELELNHTIIDVNARSELKNWTAGKNTYQFEHHKDISEKLVKDSGSWLFRHDAFRSWEQGVLNPSRVWLHGDAGWGKSFLCSAVIKHLKASTGRPVVAYLFLSMSENIQGIQMRRDLSSQLLDQLYERQPDYKSQTLLNFRHSNNEDPDCLEQFIEQLTFELQPVFILLDGLDEAGESVESNTLFKKDGFQAWSVEIMVQQSESSLDSQFVERLS